MNTQPSPSGDSKGLESRFFQWLTEVDAVTPSARAFREAMETLRSMLDEAFDGGVGVCLVIERLTQGVDRLLQRAWGHFGLDQYPGVALLAVGGYGRGELHPGSDIDVLILHEASIDQALEERISQFLTFLWDMRLDLGSSVRSIESCIEEGARDLSIATTFFESRLLAGPERVFRQFQEAIESPEFWPSRTFFQAKLEEQQARHARFGDTAYRIEPNLKESPGGLRDIQILSWILTRHFGVKTLEELVVVGFLQEDEFRLLDEARKFLWRVRYVLHRLAGRKEDRLLLEHQKSVAAFFGFTDKEGNLAVEHFMKQYFGVATDIQRLNEMLFQLFEEQITLKNVLSPPRRINERFQSRSGYLEITRPDVFKEYPPAILELFLVLQRHPDLVGVRASTIRAIRSHLYLIDEKFRQDPRCQAIFVQMLAQPAGIYHEFRHMNAYGVLANYLPEFGRIVGLMQFDLFHAYTVDEHIIMVLRYARRLSDEKYFDEEPTCSRIHSGLRNPVLLYVACLYHDIAKGRGGDHSELGVADASAFCLRHGFTAEDTELVCWLVRHHLLMSTVAQRKDISDPDVVADFVSKIRNVEYLEYLYLLTVSDIKGTNPELWNDWKAVLLAQLYQSSRKMLMAGDKDQPVAERMLNTSSTAEGRLIERGYSEARILALWETFDSGYFLHHDPEAIVWHTASILEIPDPAEPLVAIRAKGERGATEILVYVEDQPRLFYRISRAISNLGLNIAGADIYTTQAGKALQIFYILDKEGRPCREASDIELIQTRLEKTLSADEPPEPVGSVRVNRKLKSFDSRPEVEFLNPPGKYFTEVHISAGDRPGLVADISHVLAEENINVSRAFIATVSERAEDVIHVMTADGRPLSPEEQGGLRQRLLRVLENAAE